MSVNVATALQLGQVDPAIKSSICPNLRFQALRLSIKAASLSNSKVFLPLPFFFWKDCRHSQTLKWLSMKIFHVEGLKGPKLFW